ncbi:NUDIX hydrolase [Deltaproteobacteria bacterium TL4]
MNSEHRKSKVLQENMLHQGQWISLVEIAYEDEEQQLRKWECVHRKNHTEAAIIVAHLNPTGHYILTKQFRPPLGNYILEFPAGLIDACETPEQAALRELREETGYIGRVLETSPKLFVSPGLLSESCYLVFVEVDGREAFNLSPKAETEPGEHIEVFLRKPQEIPVFIQQQREEGTLLDIRVYTFFKEKGLI